MTTPGRTRTLRVHRTHGTPVDVRGAISYDVEHTGALNIYDRDPGEEVIPSDADEGAGGNVVATFAPFSYSHAEWLGRTSG